MAMKQPNQRTAALEIAYERVAQTQIFNSLGMLYTAVTEHLGFGLFEEGTVMALAATGEKTYEKKFRELVCFKPEQRLHQL